MKKVNLALLCYQMIIMAMIISSTGLALPRLEEEIGLTSVQQGSVVSIQFFGFAVAVLLGGTLADRFGKLEVLRFSFLGIGLATLLFGASTEYWMTVTGVLFIGAFGSMVQNGLTALASSIDEEKAEKNVVIIQVFFTIGAIITPLLLLILTVKLNKWRYAYYITGLLCIIMFIITYRFKHNNDKKVVSIKSAFSQYAIALKNPTYLIAPAALCLYVGSEIGVWGFAPIFFENQGYGKMSGIVASILIWISMFVGRSLTVKLLKKYSMPAILISHGILGVISLTFAIFSNQSASIIWISLSGFACAPFYGLIISWMTRLTGDNSSSTLAFAMAFGAMGPVMMGWITGVIVDSFGARYITAAPAVSLLLVVIIIALFRKKAYTGQ